MKKILTIIAATAALAACVQPEHPDFTLEDNENIQGLVIKGTLLSDTQTEYSAVIDLEAGTAVIQVPYYLSDTKPVQGDLTQMKITATLPKGAKFNPSISGIHNMVEGVETTLTYADGHSVDLKITADYKKSDAAVLSGLKNSTIVNAVRQPSNEDPKGTLSVLLTPTNSVALKTSELSYSPWATIECAALNDDGTVDITKQEDITVVSQSGLVRTTYQIAFETPQTVDYGLGQVKAMFGFQPVKSDTHGFTEGGNMSMAVVGDYLILSNAKDFTKMPVYDRFSGEYLPDVTVNTDGIIDNLVFRAITTDDAGHLFAVSYTSNKEYNISKSFITDNQTVYGYLWKDGIFNAPTCIMQADLAGSAWANAPRGINGANQFDIFNTLSVSGDLTSGDAVIATVCLQATRPVFVHFVDGSPQWPAKAEWPSGLPGTAGSFWTGSKVKMVSSNYDALEYFWSSAHWRSNLVYSKAGAGVFFDLPDSHWWKYAGGSDYSHPSGALDVIEFNGAHLLAVMNGSYSNKAVEDVNQFYWRCYVADVGANPAASSLVSGFIFDTREGGIEGTDAYEGSGFAVTGMISPYAWETGQEVLYGNLYQTYDTVFVKGDDGMSVQLYFMSTDQGLIGWNLTSLAR